MHINTPSMLHVQIAVQKWDSVHQNLILPVQQGPHAFVRMKWGGCAHIWASAPGRDLAGLFLHHYPQDTDPSGASRQSACHCSIESKWLLCECVFTHLHALKMNIVSKQVCSYVFMRIKHALMFSPLNAYFPFNYITVEKVSHTQSSLAFEDQQFLVVFRRWGGSEKKKSIRPSSANGLDTLCRTADLVGSVLPCSFKNRQFGDAPSNVASTTFKVQRSIR